MSNMAIYHKKTFGKDGLTREVEVVLVRGRYKTTYSRYGTINGEQVNSCQEVFSETNPLKFEQNGSNE